jgi:6-phosphofructokinase
MSEETDIDQDLNDIFSQLSNSAKGNTELTRKTDEVHVHNEDIEQFAVDSSAELVKKTLEIIDDIRDRACASSDPEDIQALASTIRSAAAAMESFNKIYISMERNKTVREMKKADIESKTKMNLTNNQTKLLISREEVMKQLFDKSDEPDGEVIDV